MPATVLGTGDMKERSPPQAVQLGALVTRELAIIKSKGLSLTLAASHTHDHLLNLSLPLALCSL